MSKVLKVAKALLIIDALKDDAGMSNLKLQKLIYYTQGFFLALHNKPLFDEPIEAWQHGPVSPSVYHHYKQHGSNIIPAPVGQKLELTPEELELVEEVHEVFGQFSAWRLREMTHEEPTWINHEAEASVIPHDEMKAYFKDRLNG